MGDPLGTSIKLVLGALAGGNVSMTETVKTNTWGLTSFSSHYALINSVPTTARIANCGCPGGQGFSVSVTQTYEPDFQINMSFRWLYMTMSDVTLPAEGNLEAFTIDSDFAKVLNKGGDPWSVMQQMAAYNWFTVEHELRHYQDAIRTFTPNIVVTGTGTGCTEPEALEAAAKDAAAKEIAIEQSRDQRNTADAMGRDLADYPKANHMLADIGATIGVKPKPRMPTTNPTTAPAKP